MRSFDSRLTTLGTLALALGIVVVLNGRPAPIEPTSFVERAWSDACRLSGYSCAGVARPAVRTTPRTLPILGALGVYYPGTRNVFIDETIDPSVDLKSYAVVVHEMTHYLQWVHFGWGLPAHDQFIGCEMEADAYRVSNALLRERDAPDLQRLDWAEKYGC